MVDPNRVAAFFDRLAPRWDADMIRDDAVIGTILDNAQVRSGAHVLDVACGTGVLIPDYLARNVASVTAIDLSPEMARIAADKFRDAKNVTVLCGDAAGRDYERRFDCIVVYNAFPHFADRDEPRTDQPAPYGHHRGGCIGPDAGGGAERDLRAISYGHNGAVRCAYVSGSR